MTILKRSLLTQLLIVLTLAAAPALAQKGESVPMPRIFTIGEGMVWRTSDNKNQKGNYGSPWKEVQVTNVFGFKRAPKVGEPVTVIPLDVNVAQLHLNILKTKRQRTCGRAWWEVELQRVNEKEYFEISNAARSDEYPFDVAIIYPAIKIARQLGQNELKRAMLPAGTVLNTVKAAIDLTDDGLPDVLILKYCCLHPNKPAGECDLTCGKTFQKIRNRWKLVDTSSPC